MASATRIGSPTATPIAIGPGTPGSAPRVDTEELRIPNVREGSYFLRLLEPRRSSDKVLLAVARQAYVESVSTRRVDHPIKSLG